MISVSRNNKFITPLHSLEREIDKILDPKRFEKFKALNADQILELEKNNNRADNWKTILVHPKFKTNNIHHVTFYGHIHIGDLSGSIQIDGQNLKCGLSNATLINVNVGDHCHINNCSHLQNVHTEPKVSIINCGSITHNTNLPFLRKICIGNELGGRSIDIFPGIQYEHMVELALNREPSFQKGTHSIMNTFRKHGLNKSIIASHCELINNISVENIYLQEGTKLKGCTEVKNVFILSKTDRASSIRNGSIVRNSVLDCDVQIDSSAIIESSYMCEASSASHQVLSSHSIIGSNSHIEKGEVTSSLLGPFVGFHHQSLLISVLWPKGMGNIGYGAKIGSNHSGKSPDQECLLSEGLFFGIGASVKYPVNLEKAPFSLIASSVELKPQKIEMPFSLILKNKSGDNEIVPGWVWKHNRYMLRRNEQKYVNRNKASAEITADILQPEIIDLVLNAIVILNKLVFDKTEPTINFEALGENKISLNNLKESIQTYTDVIEHYCLKSFYEAYIDSSHQLKSLQGLLKKNLTHLNWHHARKIFKKHIHLSMSHEVLDTYLDRVKGEIFQVKNSKNRDHLRGNEIFSDYDSVHQPVNQDPVVKVLKAYAKDIEHNIHMINSL